MSSNEVTGQVHVIFKTHLDVGFTDLAARVVERYFTEFIPAALRTASDLRDSGSDDRFIWTTGSWLIYEYLERAGPGDRSRMENAIAAGDITWHAMPFTMHCELAEPSLFRFGLRLSQILDSRFGKKTIAAKMTDVPGHTRAIVPLLAEAGVEFLHIGVNEASTVPDVPQLFQWRDTSGADIVVMYNHSYGATVSVAGLPDCISFAHTMDNRGPQDAEEVRRIYSELRTGFPGARVVGSTLDDFARTIRPVRELLPVVTSEIGDTWIHGVGSDPYKVARFRELSRLRARWIADKPESVDDPRVEAFSRQLLMVPEHTWGVDDKTYLGDYDHYTQSEFESVKQSPPFLKMEESWEEQRRYIDDAVRALGSLPQKAMAEERLRSLIPQRLRTDLFDRVKLSDIDLSNDFFKMAFDESTGALNLLEDRRTGFVISGPTHLLGQISCQSYSHEDYERFLGQYIKRGFDWAPPDFCKPGLDRSGAGSGVVRFAAEESWYAADREKQTVILRLHPEATSRELYGGPGEVHVTVTLPTAAPEIRFEVQWFGKPASRLPHACWMSFVPRSQKSERWWIQKLGAMIAADEVVSNGGRALHAIQEYIELVGQSRTLRITTLDAPLVAIGEPSLLNFTNLQPQARDGAHFNLYNNVWGTNFPSWFEGDARFRFVLSLRENPKVP